MDANEVVIRPESPESERAHSLLRRTSTSWQNVLLVASTQLTPLPYRPRSCELPMARFSSPGLATAPLAAARFGCSEIRPLKLRGCGLTARCAVRVLDGRCSPSSISTHAISGVAACASIQARTFSRQSRSIDRQDMRRSRRTTTTPMRTSGLKRRWPMKQAAPKAGRARRVRRRSSDSSRSNTHVCRRCPCASTTGPSSADVPSRSLSARRSRTNPRFSRLR